LNQCAFASGVSQERSERAMIVLEDEHRPDDLYGHGALVEELLQS
jgi:hypothetical protein